MLTAEKKNEIINCIYKQFPDTGMYRVSRVTEWLMTNGCSLEKLGYKTFADFAESVPELFEFPKHGAGMYIIIKRNNISNGISFQAKADRSQSTSYEKQYSEENSRISSGSAAPLSYPYYGQNPADNFWGNKTIMLNDDLIEMSQQSLYALTKVLGNGLTVQEMKRRIYESFNTAKENNTLNFIANRYTFPIDYCTDGFLVNGIIAKNAKWSGCHEKFLYFLFEKTSIFKSGASPEGLSEIETEVSPEDQEKIYHILASRFPFDTELHMAAVSKQLMDNHIDRSKYNCFKMKDLLAKLDYLELNEAILGGVPQIMVTLRRKPEYGEIERVITFNHNEELSGEPPEGDLEDFCNLPAKPMIILSNYLILHNFLDDASRLNEILSEDYENARTAKNIRVLDSKIVFPLRYPKTDGQLIEITLKQSSYEGKPWFLYYVDTVSRENSRQEIAPGKQLENFAFLGSWTSFLSELAEKAIPEEWDFADSPVKDLHILIRYIKYTFYRLVRENKICVSSDGQFAAFNTGLVDNHYDDIYACFVPNDSDVYTKWKFSCFCTAVSRGPGKLLVNYFNPLPQPPCYFKNGSELFFDLNKQLHTDFEHIIIDNVKRLPVRFLEEQFMDVPEAMAVLNEIKSSGERCDNYTAKALYEELKKILADNSRLFVRIQNRIKDSIELSKKRIRWNYKTAIPSYYPRRDSLSIMLPLCLTDEKIPDVALVVELTPSGNYRGQTILTMPQAYIDARLLCRPDSDWLSTTSISGRFHSVNRVHEDDESEDYEKEDYPED